MSTVLAALAVPVAADVPYEIINGSPLTVMEIYASAMGETSWSDDLLYAHVIPPGKANSIRIASLDGQCDYSLLLILEDGREQRHRTNICRTKHYTLGPLE
ncbi:hypothetical protein FHG71_19750 [Rubellimicrobium roseum]|uniref:Uncharacterized protein n=1 Tax=Rubellimicrobium roseum TaxID=687525 RepID=A0A5C4N7G4_9RHOB|nr:hypothetical protein FHG71_19750 [Rubellimicrobium roseum]